ncbi:MAG: EscU/YscU/HrcU family type III secretion system export apparatus switch protein [Chromatiales bacterium]|nr:EscU/YscU/HrcU family type III secretion system export apparatus switch protein [Chromatiales bacterium]
MDFNSFFVIAALLGILYGWGEGLIRNALRLAQRTFVLAPSVVFDVPHLMTGFGDIVSTTVFLLAPIFVVAVLVMIAANLIQTGPVFSAFPLKPDPQRINPVAGFKRVVPRGACCSRASRASSSWCCSGLWPCWSSRRCCRTCCGCSTSTPRRYAPLLMNDITTLLFKLALVVLLVAAIDTAYTRWDFGKKMMMSTREVKEEVKRREGDPHVRAKQRELQREAAKRSKSLGQVPDADVLITNPTHFAVALRYQQGRMSAPTLTAKGAGELALAMRAVARARGVPVLEQPPLARGAVPRGRHRSTGRCRVRRSRWRKSMPGCTPRARARRGWRVRL